MNEQVQLPPWIPRDRLGIPVTTASQADRLLTPGQRRQNLYDKIVKEVAPMAKLPRQIVPLLVAFMVMCNAMAMGASARHQPAIVEHVDIIEINQTHDLKSGELRLEQVIFWNWHQPHEEYRVRDWRMMPKDFLPRYSHRSGRWTVEWHDAKQSRHRIISADILRRTVTAFDPEVEDRKYVPESSRFKLR